MATAIGNVPSFDANSCSFSEWTEILEAWCLANDVIDENKKRAVFLTSLGPKAYHTLRSLLQPEKPTTKSYEDCVKKLTEHFAPTPSEIVLRYRFHVRSQKPGESIADFVAYLRNLSEGCHFENLDKALRDRLVVGCHNVSIQRRLLSEKDLTFAKAFQTASAMEMAMKDVEDIKKMANPEVKVNKLSTKPQWKGGKSQQGPASRKCWRCGGKHDANTCPFKTSQCFSCKQTGHTKSQCDAVKRFRQNRKPYRQGAHYLEDSDSEEGEEQPEMLRHLEEFTVNRLSKSEPYQVQVYLNNSPVTMELDTGSPWSIISSDTYHKIGDQEQVHESPVRLRTYNGTRVDIRGQTEVEVRLADGRISKKLPLLVVDKGVNLLGRDWIEGIPISLAAFAQQPVEAVASSGEVRALEISEDLQTVLAAHERVFEDTEHGKLTTCKARMYPTGGDQRIFFKASSVAYATKAKVDKHLDRMLNQGIIEPVRFSEYACPIVVADKPNGDIRICGNYKLTANKVLSLEHYPIPSLDDMVQSLHGGKKFSKVDLSHAYNQVELEDDSKQYTTINTHRGLFRYNRLPYGIASAPAWFQRTMETLLNDIPMCRPYLDDVIISGRTDEEHLANLNRVLERLEESGMRLKREKCEFMQESITYLGHRIDKAGIYPLEEKLEAIQNAPEPKNQEELRSYLGLLGYYRQFIPKLTDHIAPLNELLKSDYSSQLGHKKAKRQRKKSNKSTQPDPKFRWGSQEKQAFAASKKLLQKGKLLVHYDQEKVLLLQTDASQYGLGAVISHMMPDGSERPIAFASRTMNDAEKKYAQYEKEALSIIFGLTKFHKYLHGRSFQIVTDHQPLVSLFGDKKPVSPMASARIARWHIKLSGYQYTIVHKSGRDHSNADALSRLPLPGQEQEVGWLEEDWENDEIIINLLKDIDSQPVNSEDIKDGIKRDATLRRVRDYLHYGWPEKSQIEADVLPYHTRKEELTLEDNIILWGHRVIIPASSEIRVQLKKELHSTHPGIVKMKALARSYFWWPKLDEELEQVVRTCPECQENQREPSKVPMHPWEFPPNPWQRIHIDYATVDGQEVLIGVDAHSKWIEAVIMKSTTASATVKELRRWFARYGLPETVVSDNGPQFVSEEFFTFLTENGIKHVQTAPYHPSSNGLAERAVQTVKYGVKKMTGELEVRIQKHLMMYRLTPQATTGYSPSELMMKRKIRSKLDQLRPDLTKKVIRKQTAMKESGPGRHRQLETHDQVLVKNFGAGPTRLYGRVKSPISPTMFEVELEDGRVVRRHLDHISKCESRRSELVIPEIHNDLVLNPSTNEYVSLTHKQISVTPLAQHQSENTSVSVESIGKASIGASANLPSRERSTRVKQLPSKFRDFVVETK